MPDPYQTMAEATAQKALLVFRAPDGKLWLAAALLTPMRPIGGEEERGYAEADGMKLSGFKLVLDD